MSSRLDYKLLQALAAVVREQSFERAAAAIFITQSAISQRIKQLEQIISQPVLVRSTPPKATEIGKQLISHYYQVEQLEQALHEAIFPSAEQTSDGEKPSEECAWTFGHVHQQQDSPADGQTHDHDQ